MNPTDQVRVPFYHPTVRNEVKIGAAKGAITGLIQGLIFGTIISIVLDSPRSWNPPFFARITKLTVKSSSVFKITAVMSLIGTIVGGRIAYKEAFYKNWKIVPKQDGKITENRPLGDSVSS